MPDKLSLYNFALSHLAQRPLLSLTEDTPARYALDVIWDNGVVDACLEQAYWTFAMRAQQIPYDADITPGFGYSKAFPKPVDWIRTSSLSQDEFFTTAFNDYTDEQQYWFADIDMIYVRFVSNDIAYGGDINGWSPSFTDYFAAHLAVKSATAITGVIPSVYLLQTEQTLLKRARSKNSLNEATRFPRLGSWVSARLGNLRGSRMTTGEA